MPASTAKQLVGLIAQAVEEIEADAATQIPGGTTTDINTPTVAPEDKLEVTPGRRNAMRTLKAATHQLLSTLIPAGLHIRELHSSYFQTVAIQVALRARIADLIHSIDPDSSQGGVHVETLAQKAGMDPQKLSHIMRFLALRNIFCELSLDHWGNTRFSLPLCTDSPNSQCNLLGHEMEEIAIPAFMELTNVLLDKGGAALSKNHRESAFQKYYKPEGDFFDFLSKSEGGYRVNRFGKAMVEASKATGAGDAHYKAFEWKKLGPEGTLIDVGGGIGAAAYPISTHLPGWTVVVQDRAEVVKDAKENYQRIKSTARLEFEEADFLKGQPSSRIGMADAYFLRHILHDWPNHVCVQILTHLRKAAKPTTRLLICEIRLEAPLIESNSPILSNGGMATSISHNLDLSMLTLFNAQERTKSEFSEIFHASGWTLKDATPLATVLDTCIFEGLPNPVWKQNC